MKPIKFSALYLSRLTNGEIFSLGKSSIDLSVPVESQLGAIEKAALEQLKAAMGTLGMALNKNQKSELTEEAQKFEKLRDEDILEIFRRVKSDLRSRSEEKKQAASKLQLFIAPYKGMNRFPLDVESGILFEFCEKYNASPDLKNAANSIGISDLFDDLATNNAAFDDIYNRRTVGKASRGTSASAQRNKAIAAYSQYATAIEQAVNLMPNETITALFNQLDQVRKQYRPLESGKKGNDKEAGADGVE